MQASTNSLPPNSQHTGDCHLHAGHSGQVKPNAGVSALEKLYDGSYAARLKSPPIGGKANAELISLVSHHFAAKSAVTIESGAEARLKLVAVAVA